MAILSDLQRIVDAYDLFVTKIIKNKYVAILLIVGPKCPLVSHGK